MNASSRVLQQIVRFGLVGGLATLLHVGVFVSLADGAGFHPQMANLLAWLAAFALSFLGHFHWTFRESPGRPARRARDALVRFLGVSLFGLALNSGIVVAVVDVSGGSNAMAALLMATAVPLILFAINRYWAFSAAPQ